LGNGPARLCGSIQSMLTVNFATTFNIAAGGNGFYTAGAEGRRKPCLKTSSFLRSIPAARRQAIVR
jgi:hypothetical protein